MDTSELEKDHNRDKDKDMTLAEVMARAFGIGPCLSICPGDFVCKVFL
jgi:hypothetical protein